MKPNLKKSEQVSRSLRALYEKYGFRKYRMGKFEEYAFYIDNKNFLVNDSVITFNDLDGRLLALKPDVTLSIAKSASPGDKFYYTENVYRPSLQSNCFQEIEQTGLETVGTPDRFSEYEVLLLALKSLAEIEDTFVLDLSHMSLTESLINRLARDFAVKLKLTACLKAKNIGEALALCPGCDRDILTALFEKSTPTLLNKLALRYPEIADGVSELTELVNLLTVDGYGDNLRTELSLINDESYYNGIVFQGYVKRVPRAVLSGGRYDKLVEKMGKKTGAVGFAVYLNEMTVYDQESEFDFDVMIQHDGKHFDDVLSVARRLREEGKRVRVERLGEHSGVRCAQTLVINGENMEGSHA